MPHGFATRALMARGLPVVEVKVGPPTGYALVSEADHARIEAEAATPAAYRRAVMRAAAVFSRDGFSRLPERKA